MGERKTFLKAGINLISVVAALLLLFASTVVLAADRVEYCHTDALGSVIASTDEGGNVLWRESYRPFGDRMLKEVSTQDNTPFYTGKPHDDATGLSYFGARYYDPNLGRFLGVDPAGVDPTNLHSFNRYAYANNNPYKYVDPDGRESIGVGTEFDGDSFSGGLGTSGLSLQKGTADIITAIDTADTASDMVAPIKGLTKLAIKKAIKKTIKKVPKGVKNNKRFSDEKQALVDMAKKDKKTDMTADDMQAYKDLNKELPDPFPSNKVRGPEVHPNRPHGKEPHGHVGPVDHIPIKDK